VKQDRFIHCLHAASARWSGMSCHSLAMADASGIRPIQWNVYIKVQYFNIFTTLFFQWYIECNLRHRFQDSMYSISCMQYYYQCHPQDNSQQSRAVKTRLVNPYSHSHVKFLHISYYSFPRGMNLYILDARDCICFFFLRNFYLYWWFLLIRVLVITKCRTSYIFCMR